MRVIKRVNNNAVLCVDDDGRQVIALGRGLSSVPVSSELDLNLVTRTFYDVDPRYVDILRDIPGGYLAVSGAIIDVARGMLPYELNANIEITLADHIAFAVQRMNQGILFTSPLTYDVQQNYPLEFKIAEYALTLIKDQLGTMLPRNEATGIALAFINGALDAGTDHELAPGISQDRMLSDITDIVEQTMNVAVDRESFLFSRFATHMLYLIRRASAHEEIETGLSGAYESLAEGNPAAAACVEGIALYLESTFHQPVADEEKLYIFLHVNRMCTRSDNG